MRVLIVTNMYPTPDRPYYGIFVKEQVEAIRQLYSDIDFDIYYVDGRNSKMAYLKSIFAIDRRLRKRHYDIVHVHYGLSGLFLLNPFRKKTPTIVTLHGGDIQAEQGKTNQVMLTKMILRNAKAAVTLNGKMTDIAGKYCSNIHQIPCSVDTSQFIPPQNRTPLSDTDPIKVIFPSSPSRPVKNYPLFRDTVDRISSMTGRRCTVSAVEGMSRQEVARLYRHSDMMIMTSVSEGSPQVVKDAMACNLPIVSTNVGDVADLLDGVENCTWSDSHDSGNLCSKAIDVIQGKVLGIPPRKKIAEMGLDHDSTARKIYRLYQSVLSAHE